MDSLEILKKYFPFAIDIANTSYLLEDMGVAKRDISTIFSQGYISIYGRIYNPHSHKKYFICTCCVSLEIDSEDRVNILIDNLPYKRYFEGLDNQNRELLSADDKTGCLTYLMEENKLLKEVLSCVDEEKFLEVKKTLKSHLSCEKETTIEE